MHEVHKKGKDGSEDTGAGRLQQSLKSVPK